jgi:hypothetical protein
MKHHDNARQAVSQPRPRHRDAAAAQQNPLAEFLSFCQRARRDQALYNGLYGESGLVFRPAGSLQHNKGRDLFDLDHALTVFEGLNTARITECFRLYPEKPEVTIFRAEAQQRMLQKLVNLNAVNVLEREAVLNHLLAKFAGDTSIVRETQALDIGFDDFIAPFTTRDIGGMYLGFLPDPVEIFANPRGFMVRIQGEDRYQFEASPENRLVMHAKLPTSIGLFKDPGNQQPALMMAMNAFRKIK